MIDARSALVLFSGGQDSTTCLAWALERFEQVETIAFDYRQRHRIELDQRLVVLDQVRRRFPAWAGRLGADHFIDIGVLGQISETSLTRETAFQMEKDGLPNSFVPGRNLLFFTFAAAVAWRRGIRHLVGGMCETDFSGYPDCRDDTIKALQVALNLGMDRSFALQTPLMWLDKAATWALARQLGGDLLIEVLLEHTHTCYRNERGPRNDWGHGCGECPACALRQRGFAQWQKSLA
jgi:7-cyano-7-deazaguanine synthase